MESTPHDANAKTALRLGCGSRPARNTKKHKVLLKILKSLPKGNRTRYSLTGGDKITARYLFAEYFDFYFEVKLWLATNRKPVIKDQWNGMWDRVKLIPSPYFDTLTEMD
jgi:hypothetical protein